MARRRIVRPQGTASTHSPLRHLSMRVPWMDTPWDGTVCHDAALNQDCKALSRIADNRADPAVGDLCHIHAGQSMSDLKYAERPCCFDENAWIMSSEPMMHKKVHRYKELGVPSHQDTKDADFQIEPYSGNCVPFAWFLKDFADEWERSYGADFDESIEPDLGFETIWWQAVGNQRMIMDRFWSHIRPKESLVFMYAKRTPFYDGPERVLIGVGRVLGVGPIVGHMGKGKSGPKALVWERNVQHTIRETCEDGFILPYHAALEQARKNPKFDPSPLVAVVPSEHREHFSFASSLVVADTAIDCLLELHRALAFADQHMEGDWSSCLQWLDDRLHNVWDTRGPYPGMGAALRALGLENGVRVAYAIESRVGAAQDPWDTFEKAINDPHGVLPEVGGSVRGAQALWKGMDSERKELLRLLSRLELTPEQAEHIFQSNHRRDYGIHVSDSDLLENPYKVFEKTRLTPYPIPFGVVDRGLFPADHFRKAHPLPTKSAVEEGNDQRRVRAFIIDLLEKASDQGDTFLPGDRLMEMGKSHRVKPECHITQDLLKGHADFLKRRLEVFPLEDDQGAYQLNRLQETGGVIRKVVGDRLGKKIEAHHPNPIGLQVDWSKVLDREFGAVSSASDPKREERARKEKIAALQEMERSRFTVVSGLAGTGKTTLVAIFCNEMRKLKENALMLAPTGKARVRLHSVMSKHGFDDPSCKTIAQFLFNIGRFDVETQRYYINREMDRVLGFELVVIDEMSMVTEEMLAAVLDAVGRRPKRIILVGDHRQLPPIGAGRPLLDIFNHLTKKMCASKKPRVGKGFSDLWVTMRTQEENPSEPQFGWRLANSFGGGELGKREIDNFHLAATTKTPNFEAHKWETPEELEEILFGVLKDKLQLRDGREGKDYDKCLGMYRSSGGTGIFRPKSAPKVEEHQILSPVKSGGWGVHCLNQFVHKTLRAHWVAEGAKALDPSRRSHARSPIPMGEEHIVYGDKVICTRNHWHKVSKGSFFIANGDMGIAWIYKNESYKKAIRVSFAQHKDRGYSFDRDYFNEGGEQYLTLAYALTIHKAQGSEFALTILVLPRESIRLSREAMYTALTRYTDSMVVLYQGQWEDFLPYTFDEYSEAAARLTNLFETPALVSYQGKTFHTDMLHVAQNGVPLRSKSEVIVMNALLNCDQDPKYEKPLTLGDRTIYPDFTMVDGATGKTYYWEHLGMLGKSDYARKWQKKLELYKRHGIVPYSKGAAGDKILITSEDSKAGGINAKDIKVKIEEVFGAC